MIGKFNYVSLALKVYFIYSNLWEGPCIIDGHISITSFSLLFSMFRSRLQKLEYSILLPAENGMITTFVNY